MKILIPIILQIIGSVIILAEAIIPSAGILAITATALFTYSLYLVFTNVSVTAGYLFIACDIFIVPLTILAGIKLLEISPATLKKDLSSKNGVITQSPAMKELIGLNGEVISDLRPAGTAVIEGKRLDVVTRGEYLEKASKITVISVTGNQVIVAKLLND